VKVNGWIEAEFSRAVAYASVAAMMSAGSLAEPYAGRSTVRAPEGTQVPAGAGDEDVGRDEPLRQETPDGWL